MKNSTQNWLPQIADQPHFFSIHCTTVNSLVYAGARNTNDVIIKAFKYHAVRDLRIRKRAMLSLDSEINYERLHSPMESIPLVVKLVLKWTDGRSGKDCPPLVLITFLENTFKHGVSDQEAGAGSTLTFRWPQASTVPGIQQKNKVCETRINSSPALVWIMWKAAFVIIG